MEMTSFAVTVELESPRAAEVASMIQALDAYLTSLYPVESNHLLDIATLCGPSFRFFVARGQGQALGCGALRLEDGASGEIKRMFVHPHARGRRVGRAIVLRIEEEARAAGLTTLHLETGIHQAEAIGLYRSLGYQERGPFGDYRPDRLSLFMEKKLR